MKKLSESDYPSRVFGKFMEIFVNFGKPQQTQKIVKKRDPA
jgi:hypothetical protein